MHREIKHIAQLPGQVDWRNIAPFHSGEKYQQRSPKTRKNAVALQCAQSCTAREQSCGVLLATKRVRLPTESQKKPLSVLCKKALSHLSFWKENCWLHWGSQQNCKSEVHCCQPVLRLPILAPCHFQTSWSSAPHTHTMVCCGPSGHKMQECCTSSGGKCGKNISPRKCWHQNIIVFKTAESLGLLLCRVLTFLRSFFAAKRNCHYFLFLGRCAKILLLGWPRRVWAMTSQVCARSPRCNVSYWQTCFRTKIVRTAWQVFGALRNRFEKKNALKSGLELYQAEITCTG